MSCSELFWLILNYSELFWIILITCLVYPQHQYLVIIPDPSPCLPHRPADVGDDASQVEQWTLHRRIVISHHDDTGLMSSTGLQDISLHTDWCQRFRHMLLMHDVPAFWPVVHDHECNSRWRIKLNIVHQRTFQARLHAAWWINISRHLICETHVEEIGGHRVEDPWLKHGLEILNNHLLTIMYL